MTQKKSRAVLSRYGAARPDRMSTIGAMRPADQLWHFFFQAEDGIRDHCVTGVQTCALPISVAGRRGGQLMGELGGFLKIERHGPSYRPAGARVADYQEFVAPAPEGQLREQGARCMDCGVPFCHNGCPLGNLIPDWNDLVYHRRFEEAMRQLHATNNFPDFTGRLCPAPCEAACVLEIREGEAVTIKQIEQAIVDRAWAEGWVVPEPPRQESGRSVAVIGSGPAGMAAAQQLRRAGQRVELFERDEAAGGLV